MRSPFSRYVFSAVIDFVDSSPDNLPGKSTIGFSKRLSKDKSKPSSLPKELFNEVIRESIIEFLAVS